MFDWTCPGHRCKDSPRVVSLGEASAGDFVDVDTGLPYILVTKYSQVWHIFTHLFLVRWTDFC